MKNNKPHSITFKQMVLQNVNQWRRKNKLPLAGHESPQEFKANFNAIGNKLHPQPRAQV